MQGERDCPVYLSQGTRGQKPQERNPSKPKEKDGTMSVIWCNMLIYKGLMDDRVSSEEHPPSNSEAPPPRYMGVQAAHNRRVPRTPFKDHPSGGYLAVSCSYFVVSGAGGLLTHPTICRSCKPFMQSQGHQGPARRMLSACEPLVRTLTAILRHALGPVLLFRGARGGVSYNPLTEEASCR